MKSLKYLILLVFITGCNFAPRYERPCVEVPDGWRFGSDMGSTCVNIRWWEELGDPILNELILEALQNNKDLKTAMWRVCEFAARYQIDSSLLYPQIASDGSAVREKFPVASFIPPGFNPVTPHYQYEFTLAYEIDFWGRVRNLSLAGYEELLASVENRRTVVLSLVSAVAQAYVRLRELDRELVISYLTLRDREEYLDIAWKRFRGGLTSEIEVDQALSVLEETRAVITRLEAEIPIQEDLISLLIGSPPKSISRGETLEQFELPPCVPAGLPSELLERRPDILEAENKLRAANARIGVARAELLPKISLTGLFGGNSFQLSQLFTQPSRMWLFGGEYSWELFTGGRLTGRVKEAIAIQQEIAYQYEQTVLTAFKEVSDALIAHQQSKELVSVEKKRVAAVAEYLKLAWLRYYNGQTDYLTVLDAERQLFRAEIALARAQADVYFTLVDLYKSLGGGWVWDADACLTKNCY